MKIATTRGAAMATCALLVLAVQGCAKQPVAPTVQVFPGPRRSADVLGQKAQLRENAR